MLIFGIFKEPLKRQKKFLNFSCEHFFYCIIANFQFIAAPHHHHSKIAVFDRNTWFLRKIKTFVVLNEWVSKTETEREINSTAFWNFWSFFGCFYAHLLAHVVVDKFFVFPPPFFSLWNFSFGDVFRRNNFIVKIFPTHCE